MKKALIFIFSFALVLNMFSNTAIIFAEDGEEIEEETILVEEIINEEEVVEETIQEEIEEVIIEEENIVVEEIPAPTIEVVEPVDHPYPCLLPNNLFLLALLSFALN